MANFGRFVGVADIAAVRFSLPAQLLEPTPNLGKDTKALQPVFVGGARLMRIRILELPRPARNLHQVWLLVIYYRVWMAAYSAKSIGDSDDDLGRMLAVLRFWFTKDLVRLISYLCFSGAALIQDNRNMSKESLANPTTLH